MCPLCYIPWIVTLLSVFGAGGAHLWIDENPILASGIFIFFLVTFSVGIISLWKYYKTKYFDKKSCNKKICEED